MTNFHQIILEEHERPYITFMILNLLIEATTNGLCVVFQSYGGKLPLMPGALSDIHNNPHSFMLNAISSHLQIQYLKTPDGDTLAPTMIVVSVVPPNEPQQISPDYSLVHIYTELAHEVSHARTWMTVNTLENSILHDPCDSEEKCMEAELQYYKNTLPKELYRKIIQIKLNGHIYRTGPGAKYNRSIEMLREANRAEETDDCVQDQE